MRLRIFVTIGASIALLVGTGVPAQAVTPKQTIAKLRSQLAAQKRATATAKATAAQEKTTIVTLQAQAAQGVAALATANANLATANAANAATQASLAAAQGTVGSLQAALAGSVATQIGAMTTSQLWSVLGTVNSRFIAFADSHYTTSYFAGTSFFSYDFDYFTS